MWRSLIVLKKWSHSIGKFSDLIEERALSSADDNNGDNTKKIDENASFGDKTAPEEQMNKKHKSSSITKPDDYTVMDSIMTGLFFIDKTMMFPVLKINRSVWSNALDIKWGWQY